MNEPSSADVVPVFFLSDSTGISAETMGNALLIQFPDLHFERRLIPFITSVEEARRVVAILDAAADGPVTPLAFSTTAVTRSGTSCTSPLPADRLLRPAHRAGRVDPRGQGDAGGRPAARGRRHQALQHPDGRGRVRDRARRRPEPAGARQGRRHPARAVALRQDADHDVPGPAARGLRGQLPAGARRTSRPPTCPGRSGSCGTGASASPPPRPGSARSATSAGRTRATPRSSSAPTSCARPRRCTAPTASP